MGAQACAGRQRQPCRDRARKQRQGLNDREHEQDRQRWKGLLTLFSCGRRRLLLLLYLPAQNVGQEGEQGEDAGGAEAEEEGERFPGTVFSIHGSIGSLFAATARARHQARRSRMASALSRWPMSYSW